MSNSKITPGSRYVPEFQISGLPFLTRSVSSTTNNPQIIEFPYLTQWIWVYINNGIEASVAFTPSGFSTGNRYEIPGHGILGPLNLAINKLYISTSGTVTTINIAAGLTTIPSNSYQLVSTGAISGLTGSLSIIDTNYFSYRGI